MQVWTHTLVHQIMPSVQEAMYSRSSRWLSEGPCAHQHWQCWSIILLGCRGPCPADSGYLCSLCHAAWLHASQCHQDLPSNPGLPTRTFAYMRHLNMHAVFATQHGYMQVSATRTFLQILQSCICGHLHLCWTWTFMQRLHGFTRVHAISTFKSRLFQSTFCLSVDALFTWDTSNMLCCNSTP